MRIGLDARTLVQPRPHGTGRNLLDAYRIIPRLRPDWEFVLYHQLPHDPDCDGPDEPWHYPNVHLRRLDFPGDRFNAWFHLRLPLAALRDGLDLLHCPANLAPAWSPVPLLVTIHDLVPLRLAGEMSPRLTAAFRRGVKRAVRRARHLITPSRATRSLLEQDFGVQAERATIVPWAADARIVAAAQEPPSPDERDRLQAEYGLAARYLITFSGSSRRKNAQGVLAAFARVPSASRAGVQVVLVGCEPADNRATLTATAAGLGLADQCRVLGFVPHADLPGLLRGAAGLLMPSLGEGFGLPILDAFVCGVPVLTSGLSSMPEVAGDAAVYCDPYAPASIAAGIVRLLDREVAVRLVARGKSRAKQFSWERTAEAMCAVYERSGRKESARGEALVLEGAPR